MNRRILAAAGFSFSLLFAQGAMAKVISMGTLSRAVVQQACRSAGGSVFGMKNDDAVYGCRSTRGSVVCAPDSACAGYVGDLIPVTGSSVEEILGIPKRGGATRVAPVDSRIGSSAAQ
jgi:hypothetical protein